MRTWPSFTNWVKSDIASTHFMSDFYAHWKRKKTTSFLMFSGRIEMWHWTKMALHPQGVLPGIPNFVSWIFYIEYNKTSNMTRFAERVSKEGATICNVPREIIEVPETSNQN